MHTPPPINIADHEIRMRRARLSLEGLSVGDGFGERFFGRPGVVGRRIEGRVDPPGPWIVTDDTVMAISVVETLEHSGFIDRPALAKAFAARYALDPHRGYGPGAHGILLRIHAGIPWEEAAARAFGGAGSLGNGGAMRVAPLGGYFADLPDRLVGEASASAEVTHAHAEGRAGAVAVAAAAAWAANRGSGPAVDRGELLRAALDVTPDGATRRGIAEALKIPFDLSVPRAAGLLGNGSFVTAPDTVPFCLWTAARHIGDYREALWATVGVGGDIDTNCAIVGGIVALAVGLDGIPARWRATREPLPFQTPNP